MMFRFFRFILIVLSLATLVLAAFALTGSYKAESFLTNAYLIDFQLNNLDLSKVIDTAAFPSKRLVDEHQPPTPVYRRASIMSEISSAAPAVASAVASAVALPGTSPAGYYTSVQAAIQDLLQQVTPSDLGLADVYTVSYWGYCKGSVSSKKTYDDKLQKYILEFNNDQVNITWCSPAKAAYAFDPLEVFKQELNNTLTKSVNGAGLPSDLSTTIKSEIQVLLDNISYESLNLPGSLQNDISTLNTVTKASFVLVIVFIALSAISLIFQLLAFCLSPDNCCLSFLNFLLETIIFIIGLAAAACATGTYLFVRKQVNNSVGEYGVKSFLSVNFYAFIWSAAVAALLVVIMSLLGHCCGMFGTNRRRYRSVAPPVAYEHYEK